MPLGPGMTAALAQGTPSPAPILLSFQVASFRYRKPCAFGEETSQASALHCTDYGYQRVFFQIGQNPSERAEVFESHRERCATLRKANQQNYSEDGKARS